MVAVITPNNICCSLLVLFNLFCKLLAEEVMADAGGLLAVPPSQDQMLPFYLFRRNPSDDHYYAIDLEGTDPDWAEVELPTKRVHSLSLLRFTNKIGAANQVSPFAERTRDKRVHALSLLRFSNKLNAHPMSTSQLVEMSSPEKRMHGLSLLRHNFKFGGQPVAMDEGREKRVHGLSLLRFTNKLNGYPLGTPPMVDISGLEKRVHGLSRFRYSNPFGTQPQSSFAAAETDREKRVHGLSLLRYNSKLSAPTSHFIGEDSTRDKRIHNLSLLRFNGKSPLGLIRHPKLALSFEPPEEEPQEEGERSKRMHHLSLLRNGKLFHNQAADSADQQKRFDVVDRLRWQQFLQLQAKRLQN